MAHIKTVEEHPNADRLWVLNLDLGADEPERQIVAGIRSFYSKEDLEGRQIVIVKNLKPATLRGVESSGMLLAAKHDNSLTLVTVDGATPPGTKLG